MAKIKSVTNIQIYDRKTGAGSWQTNNNKTSYVGFGTAVSLEFSSSDFDDINSSSIQSVKCILNYKRNSSNAIPINIYTGPKQINADGPGIASSSSCTLYSEGALITASSGTYSAVDIETTLDKTSSQGLIADLQGGKAIYLYAPDGPETSTTNIQKMTLEITYSTLNLYAYSSGWKQAKEVYVYNNGWKKASTIYGYNGGWGQSG